MCKVTMGKRRGRRRGRGPERGQWVLAVGRECHEVGFDKPRRPRRRLTRHGLQGCGRGRRWRIFVGWLQVSTSVKVRDASCIGEAHWVEGLGGDAVLRCAGRQGVTPCSWARCSLMVAAVGQRPWHQHCRADLLRGPAVRLPPDVPHPLGTPLDRRRKAIETEGVHRPR